MVPSINFLFLSEKRKSSYFERVFSFLVIFFSLEVLSLWNGTLFNKLPILLDFQFYPKYCVGNKYYRTFYYFLSPKRGGGGRSKEEFMPLKKNLSKWIFWKLFLISKKFSKQFCYISLLIKNLKDKWRFLHFWMVFFVI